MRPLREEERATLLRNTKKGHSLYLRKGRVGGDGVEDRLL